jgi:hypothetical protein
MAQDKKLCLSIFLVALVLLKPAITFWYGPPNLDFGSKRRVEALKTNLSNKSYEGLILGGSNAIWGINSTPYSILPDRVISNLAIHSEGHNWRSYYNFLASMNIQTNWLVYSSYDFLELTNGAALDDNSSNLIGEKQKYVFFGGIRLIGIIKNIIAPAPNNFYSIDIYGNASNFICNSSLITPVKFGPFSLKKGEIILGRVNELKKLFGTQKIILRFPPIYIKDADVLKWNNYLKELRNFMESNKVGFFSHNDSFFTKSDLMCDGPHHPNDMTQQMLSRELFQSPEIRSFRAEE